MKTTIISVSAALLALGLSAAHGQTCTIDWSTIDCGGGSSYVNRGSSQHPVPVPNQAAVP